MSIPLSRRARRRWKGGMPIVIATSGHTATAIQPSAERLEQAGFRERFAGDLDQAAKRLATFGLKRCADCGRYGSPDDVEFEPTDRGPVCGECIAAKPEERP